MQFTPKMKAFSLVELLLVLIIIAALSITAFIVFPRVEADREATREVQILTSALAATKSVYRSGDYVSLTTTVANTSNIFPKSMQTSASTLMNSFDGAIVLSGSTRTGVADAVAPAQFFRISYEGIPPISCIKMANAAASNFSAIYIGATYPGVAIKNEYIGTPLDTALITTQCNEGATAILTFVSS